MSHPVESAPDAPARTVKARGGRPRLYASPAERQKAYRARLRVKAAAYDALQREGKAPVADENAGKPQTGRELFAALMANGFIGALADREDIGDSAEYARQLRQRAWARRHD